MAPVAMSDRAARARPPGPRRRAVLALLLTGALLAPAGPAAADVPAPAGRGVADRARGRRRLRAGRHPRRGRGPAGGPARDRWRSRPPRRALHRTPARTRRTTAIRRRPPVPDRLDGQALPGRGHPAPGAHGAADPRGGGLRPAAGHDPALRRPGGVRAVGPLRRRPDGGRRRGPVRADRHRSPGRRRASGGSTTTTARDLARFLARLPVRRPPRGRGGADGLDAHRHAAWPPTASTSASGCSAPSRVCPRSSRAGCAASAASGTCTPSAWWARASWCCSARSPARSGTTRPRPR